MDKRIPITAFLASSLSWYSFFSVGLLTALYFPSSLSFLGSAILYFSSFACRPIGALLLGTVSDKYGRKVGLITVFLLLGIGDGLLSTTRVTLAIPATLMIGLALGGGWSTASVTLSESVNIMRGAWSSIVQLAVPIGLLLSLSVGVYPKLMIIPSGASFLAAALSFSLPKIDATPLGLNLGGLRGLLKGILVKSGESSNFYIFTSFALPVLFQAKVNLGLIPLLVLAIEESILMIPMGFVSDVLERGTIIRIGTLLMFFSALTLSLSALSGSYPLAYASFLMFGLGDSMAYAPQGIYLAELYDSKRRVTLTGLAYQLSAVVSGGTSVVLISLFLSTGYAFIAIPLISLFYVGLSVLSV